MTGKSILTRFQALKHQFRVIFQPKEQVWLDLHTTWQHPERLPQYASETAVVQRTLDLLGPLDWQHFPERNLIRHWCQPAVSYAAFAGAMLVKLNEGLDSMGDLRQYLVEHPGLIPLLNFAVVRSKGYSWGFDPQASLPTQRHMTRMLRTIPNTSLQFLLADSARLILHELRQIPVEAGDCISLDTKHILAWVKENNPKAYVENRFDKTKQPKGDPDCKLGCKRRHNQRTSKAELPPTPRTNPLPADTIQVGEFHWGYGSGVVVVKVPEYGEFILAELFLSIEKPTI